MNAAPRSEVVSHAAWGARRGAARATTWWGKAWVRAVEEAAYDDGDLRAGRRLSRQAAVGGISVGRGRLVAAVADAQGLWSVEVALACFDAAAVAAFVEVVAAEAGRIGALLARDLPHALVEHADEAGVELLPFGGELGCSCTCRAWVDPCPHALAVLYQAAWLLDAEPLLLLHLRGLAREELLARLHARAPRQEVSTTRDPEEASMDLALSAADRAARILDQLEREASFEHLL